MLSTPELFTEVFLSAGWIALGLIAGVLIVCFTEFKQSRGHMTKDFHANAVGICIVVAIAVITASMLSSCTTGPVTPQSSPTPSPITIPSPIVSEIDKAQAIEQLVEDSSCAQYKWKNRGRAPVGYVKGVAKAMALTICRYRSPETTVAGVIGQGVGPSEKDALTLYGLDGTTGEDRIRETYLLLLSLGTRESSGRYCTGRDTSASNTSADTAEMGTFQSSYNSRGASPDRLNGLWAWYKANPNACDLATWQEGADQNHWNCKTPPAGDGPGRSWQEFVRTCPSFGAEWAATTLRTLVRHYGPAKRKELEVREDCDEMLKKVQMMKCQ